MAQDPIDEFIALPRDRQLSTLQQLAPEKQEKLLGEVKTRRSKTDFGAGPKNTEGLYQMTRPDGTPVGVPYSKVMAASGAGWKITPKARETYARDRFATLQAPAGAPRMSRTEFTNPLEGRFTKGGRVVPQPPLPEETAPPPGLWERMRTAFANAAVPTGENRPTSLAQTRSLVDTAWNFGANTVDAAGNILGNAANTVFGAVDTIPQIYSASKDFLTSYQPDKAASGAERLLQMMPRQMAESYMQRLKEEQARNPKYAADDVIGTALGMWATGKAMEKAAQPLKTAGELRKRAGLLFRKPMEALTDTGPRGLKKMAQETIEANRKAAQEAANENTKAAEKHLKETEEALHKTRGSELEADAANKQARVETAERARDEARVHEAATEQVRKHNDAVLRDRAKRARTQQKLDMASEELDEKIKTAKVKAKAADDRAWDDWREKVGTVEAPSTEIVDQIKASRSVMDPEDVAEFRKVLKETKPTGADASELQATRDSIAKQNHFGTNYESASPENKAAIDRIVADIGLDADEAEAEATKPVDAARLHVWKTQLEYAVRNATRGNVRYAIGQVLDKVRDTETKLSEAAGANEELATARALHGPYKDTFVNPPGEPRTVASTVQAKVAPEFTKESGLTEQIQMLGNYDASIPQLASHIDNLRQGLAALPKEAPLREQIKPLPSAPEPVRMPPPKQPERAAPPNRPPEVRPEQQTLGPQEIAAKRTAQTTAAGEQLRRLGVRRALNALFYNTPAAVFSTMLGHPGWSITELALSPAILLGSHVLAGVFEKPEFSNWIAKFTPQDAAAIQSFPPEERAVFTRNLTAAVNQAKQRGVAVSPVLAAFVTGVQTRITKPKTLKELRGEAQQAQQTPEETPAEIEP